MPSRPNTPSIPGGEAYCQPNIRYRTHQWQFRDDYTRFAGHEVLVETPYDGADTTGRVRSVVLPNGKRFTWFVDPHFHPTRLVDIAFTGLPEQVVPGDTLRLTMRIAEPLSLCELGSGGDRSLVMLWKHGRSRVEEFEYGGAFQYVPGRGYHHARGAVRRPSTLARRMSSSTRATW